MCLFVLCVACLTMFVNCLVKQFAMSLGVVAILLLNVIIIIGRFYYDKSTKTLYKYSHDRLEIKDIRCIHQGIEREKKKEKRMAAILIR